MNRIVGTLQGRSKADPLPTTVGAA